MAAGAASVSESDAISSDEINGDLFMASAPVQPCFGRTTRRLQHRRRNSPSTIMPALASASANPGKSLVDA
jgi:hypothetical protein